MLDELCSVCRDLLMLKTAPKGVGMVSGICTQQELQSLMPKFSPGELLRMTSILRETALGFSASANRRIDAELCIIRLCEPEAVMDLESLNARLSRLENKVANGVIAAPQPALQEQAPLDEAPPWDDDDAPPLEPMPEEPKSKPAAPSGFWPKLVERVRTVLKPPVLGMFVVSDGAPVKGALDGDVLTLEAMPFAIAQINKPPVLQAVGECAAAILGRPVKVTVIGPGQKKQANNEGFARLIQFGEQHPEFVDFE